MADVLRRTQFAGPIAEPMAANVRSVSDASRALPIDAVEVSGWDGGIAIAAGPGPGGVRGAVEETLRRLGLTTTR